MRFEIFTREDGKVGYRLEGNNGEVVMTAEGFHSEGNARRAIKRVKDSVVCAPIVLIKADKAAKAAKQEAHSAAVLHAQEDAPDGR